VNAPGLNTILRSRKKMKVYLSRRVLILLYHRVAEADSDPWGLAVSPAHFEEHLQVLERLGRVMSLKELAASVRNRTLPRRATVITFDDGYADNLFNAKPLLEKYAVPATVFIATGYVGQSREFWWDELDTLFLQPGSLPAELSLNVNGGEYHWELGETAVYANESRARTLEWKAWRPENPTPRHSIYRSLWELMQPLTHIDRQRIGDTLLEWAGTGARKHGIRRALTSEEIIELTSGGLIEAGCHTVTHPRLSSLDADSQNREITDSKRHLEEILGLAPTSFAYPYGSERDYTSETIDLVRKAGFDCGCTTSGGYVQPGAGPFQLPRFQVPDIDGDSFAWLMSKQIEA
jgi:peptidoglycan/xylan/chitin deacetylase (PgdA/CDA1 family)